MPTYLPIRCSIVKLYPVLILLNELKLTPVPISPLKERIPAPIATDGNCFDFSVCAIVSQTLQAINLEEVVVCS
jgi:hypothetical protein